VTNLAHQILLVLSAAALWAAGLRVVAPALPSGLLRLVGASVLAAAFAAAEALFLGAVGVGLRPLPLAAAAALTWIVAVRACPLPRIGALAELAAWWRSAPGAARVALGAGLGAGAVWIAYGLYRPALGPDALLYHLPVAVAFVQTGDPTSMPAVIDHLPVEAYPLNFELLTAWGMGLSDSLVAFTVLPVGLLALTALAGYAGLRELRVAPAVAGLAAAAITLAPQAVGWQFTGAVTDPAALCWVVCCGSLCAASLRQPAAYPVALIAGGLGVGTKLTAVPLTVAALGLAAVAVRGRLPRMPGVLAAASALAGFLGLFVYARNLVRYGSPLWPFYATPWGDAVPKTIQLKVSSFSEHPLANLRWLGHANLSHFAGSLVLLAAGIAAPLLTRTRAVVAASVATLVSVALWTRAPFTGINQTVYPSLEPPPTPLSTVRYLLPALAVAATALALASRRGPGARRIVVAVLALVVVVDVVQAQTELGPPEVVPLGLLALGALAGAAMAAAAGRLAPVAGLRARRALPALVLAVPALAAACVLTLAAPGYPARHTELGGWQSDITGWMESRPDYAGGGAPVAGVGLRPGLLAGPRLEHYVRFIPANAGCGEVTRSTAGAWVVAWDLPGNERALRCLAGRRPALARPPFSIYAPS
jgi:hypothetical protein